jgi:AcrR family transcriptional regulator
MPAETPNIRRGRPKLADERVVYRALLDAAKECLNEKSYNNITTREIAAHAGINMAMIGYYFGTKAGLFVELIEKMFEELHECISTIDKSTLNLHPRPNQIFVERQLKFATGWHTVLRLFSSEVAVYNTNMRDVFRKRNADMIYNDVLEFVEFMVEKEIYRTDLDTHAAALMISGLVIAPYHFTPFVGAATGCESGVVERAQWVKSFTAILDNFLNR